jgi:sensor histidine kinase YesM
MNDRLKLDFLFEKKYRPFLHGFFWFFTYADEFLSLVGLTEPMDDYLHIFYFFVFDIIIVYFNLYVLIPRFLLKNKVIVYLGLTSLSLLLNIVLSYLICDYQHNPEESALGISTYLITSFMLTGFIVGIAACIKVFKYFLVHQKETQELENNSLKTELAYLKDQLNPHFLFNALNNIYVQTNKVSNKAGDSILDLSDLLRYQLYDSSKEKVYLKNEIEYLEKYIEFNKIRTSETDISFIVKGQHENKMIAPLLLLPFVENAIKYGVTNERASFIKIVIDMERKELLFTCENSKSKTISQKLKGGIGIPNVKRRLELIYPNRHNLELTDAEEFYKAELKVEL